MSDNYTLLISNAQYDGYFDADTNEVVVVDAGTRPGSAATERVRMDVAGDKMQESLAAFVPQLVAVARGVSTADGLEVSSGDEAGAGE